MLKTFFEVSNVRCVQLGEFTTNRRPIAAVRCFFMAWNRTHPDDGSNRTSSPLEQAQNILRSLAVLQALGKAYGRDLAMTRIGQDVARGAMLAVRVHTVLLGVAGNGLSERIRSRVSRYTK